jgi:hypothetical protein
MGTSTVPAPAEAQKLSAMQRILNVFFAPSKTFTDLNRDASWWPAWLLISVFALTFIFAIQKQVGFEQVARNEIAASPKATERMERLAPDVRESQIAVQGKVTKFFTFGIPVLVIVYAAVIAGVLMATFNFGLGAEVKFSTALAIIFFAWVPGIIRSVLAAVSLFAGADPEGFNIRDPAATNIGFFISRVDHPVLQSMLSWIDIFAIWYVILIGIGFACVSKVKRGTAISVVAGWYIAVAVIGTAFTALMS